MHTIVIAYFSGYGHTKKIAEGIESGINTVDNIRAHLLPVDTIDAAGWTALAEADGIVFGSPTYMGSAAAQFKTFMDASSKQWMQRSWEDKPAGGFTNSSSPSGDKLSTLTQLAIFAAQHGMIWVNAADMPGGGESTSNQTTAINRLGAALGVMTQANADQSAEETPPANDIETAHRYGIRFAKAVLRWVR